MSSATDAPGINKQAFWLVLARTIGFLFLLGMPYVLTRVFDQAQFGIYKQVFVVVMTGVALCQFGFVISVFYFLPRMPEQRGSVILNVVLYHAITGTVVLLPFLFWPGMLTFMGSGALVPYSRMIGCIIWTWTFSSFLEYVAMADGDVKWSTRFIIGEQLSRTILLISTAAIFRTVQGLLYGALLQGFLQSFLLLWYLRRRFPLYWKQFDKSVAGKQLRYGAHYGFYGILNWAQSDLHSFLVANQFSVSQFAVYSIGTTDLPFMGILRDSLNAVLMPRVSKLHEEGRQAEILGLMTQAWRKLSIALLPACGMLLILGRDFIAAYFTPQYLAAWPIFALNLSLFVTGIFLIDSVIRTHPEKKNFFLQVRIIAAVVQAPISLLAIRMFGMIGALEALLLVAGAEQGIGLYMVMKLIGFRARDLRKLAGLVGFAVAATIAALATWAFRRALPAESVKLAFIVGSAFYGLVYVGAVIVMKLLNAEERGMVNEYSQRYLHVRLFSEAV